MVISTRPERQESPQRPWVVVSTVRLKRLDNPHAHPAKQGDNVEVSRQADPDDGTTDGSKAKDEGLERVCVFGGDSKGSGKV